MTKEQEEAIEKLKYIDRYYDCNNYYSRYDLDCIEIVLNLIQEQHVEIETKQNRIQELEKALIDDDCKYRVEIEKKDKQIEQYQNMLATNDMLHVLECEKKDKMIDLMAIAIGNEPLPTEEYCIFRNFDCPAVGGNRDCKECVKQYYERRVENGN